MDKLYLAVIGVGILLVVFGQDVLGVGLVLCGLILRLSDRMVRMTHLQSQANSQPTRDPIFIDVTPSLLAKQSGWYHIEISPCDYQYKTELCVGGPPVGKELWEYQVKEPDCVFQRLLSSCEKGIYRTEYEVVNNSVLEEALAQKNREHKAWVESLDDKDRISFYKEPYPPEKIASFAAKTMWHETHGVVKYAILLQQNAGGPWGDRAAKLKNGFEQLQKDIESLGAKRTEYGHYKLPVDAIPATQKRFDELLSANILIRKYSIPSYRDWSDRDYILELFNKSPEPLSSGIKSQ